MNRAPPADYIAIDLVSDNQVKKNKKPRIDPPVEVILPKGPKPNQINSPPSFPTNMNMIVEEEMIEYVDKEFETPSERMESKASVNESIDKFFDRSISRVQKSSPKKNPQNGKPKKPVLQSFNPVPERKTVEPSLNNAPYLLDVRASQGNGIQNKQITLNTHKVTTGSSNRKVEYCCLILIVEYDAE
jgi:hypothetical protein